MFHHRRQRCTPTAPTNEPKPLAADDLKQRRFKPLQKVAYLCMANCCDSDGSQDALQKCFAKCNQPVERAAQLYQGETQRFQGKVQRCAQSCQDEAQDMMASLGPQAGEDPKAMARVEASLAKCFAKCADSHVGQLKAVAKNTEAQLKDLAR